MFFLFFSQDSGLCGTHPCTFPTVMVKHMRLVDVENRTSWWPSENMTYIVQQSQILQQNADFMIFFGTAVVEAPYFTEKNLLPNFGNVVTNG